jgi:hypothetical protein
MNQSEDRITQKIQKSNVYSVKVPRYNYSRKTFHVYKIDCFKASRLVLQGAWDSNPVFLHKTDLVGIIPAGTNGDNLIDSRRLGILLLFRLLLADQVENGRTFVFHAQATLPYLLLSRVVLFLLKRKETTLVYDMHDLHEKLPVKGIWRYIRYNFIRYYILGLLERYCFRDEYIRKITVSEGLSREVARIYRCDMPVVVRSIPQPERRKLMDNLEGREQKALVYFGAIAHAPLSLLDSIQKAGLELHLYGRDITREAVVERVGNRGLVCVDIFGEYLPENMDFLSNYACLLFYKPEDNSINYRYSLPNKVFQALNAGLSLVVSENFIEIKELFDGIPGAVIVLESGQDITQVIERASSMRNENNIQKLFDYLYKLHEQSKQSYLKVNAYPDSTKLECYRD